MIAVAEKVSKLSLKPQTSLLLNEVGNFFSSQGIEAYIVGGFLRDLLLGRETADIDLAITADALKIAPRMASALGGRHIPLDKENRVSRLLLARGTPPARPKWQIDLSTITGSIEQDLKRRDFTINALAVDLKETHYHPGQQAYTDVPVIDPTGGLGDLEQGVIRAVSETVFKSDPLRLLRAVRLAAELGFVIDAQTEALIKNSGHLIASVAGERSREELARLLAVPNSEPLWPYLDRLGLITALIPELAPAKGVAQPREHTWDVLSHSLRTIAAVDFLLRQGSWQYANQEVLNLVPWSPELAQHFGQRVSGSTRRTLTKLAALLHDIAKPQTKMVDQSGRTRFLGHAGEGATITVSILKRLRFSGQEIRLVEAMVRHHLRPPQMSQQGELPSQRAIYRYFRDSGQAGTETLFLSLADHLATRGPNLDLANWRQHAELVAYVISQHSKQEERVAPAKLVSGHDLISIFGLSPGPKIGQILEAVGEAQASAEITTRQQALAYIANLLKSSTGEPGL